MGFSLFSILAVAALLGLLGDRVNATTVALSLLIVVLFAATFLGRNPALLASLAAMLVFNYFFLPPLGTWHIADPQNLVAWAAFTVTAVIAGELSAYARRRADESVHLYGQLQAAFAKATEAEALKQSEQLKSALLDAVTHDLRTPLTSIKAAVTTLLDSEGGHRTIELDSSGRTDFLDIINEETDRLNGFIESMVQLARVEAGSLQLATDAVPVEEIISTALQRAEPVLVVHEVRVNLEKGLPSVKADMRAIAEVIYNLVENAVKYSPIASTVTVTARRSEEGIEISVNDQGKGIPTDLREQVFEKFVRVDETSPGGMGLGLAIARGIVEAQNGHIKINTGDEGVGTKVIVTLPAQQ